LVFPPGRDKKPYIQLGLGLVWRKVPPP